MLQNEEETSTVTTTTFITPEITTYYSTQTSSTEDENDNENGYETDENGKEDDEGNGFTQTQTPVIDYSTFSTTGFTYVDNSINHITGQTTEDTELTSESTSESTTESIEDYSTKATEIFSTQPTLRSTLNYFDFFKNRTYITEPTTQYIYDVKSTTEHTTKSIPEFTSKKDFVQVNLSS